MKIKRISKIGNSKCVILDKSVLELLNIEDEIAIELINNKIVLTKPKDKNEKKVS